MEGLQIFQLSKMRLKTQFFSLTIWIKIKPTRFKMSRFSVFLVSQFLKMIWKSNKIELAKKSEILRKKWSPRLIAYISKNCKISWKLNLGYEKNEHFFMKSHAMTHQIFTFFIIILMILQYTVQKIFEKKR